MLHGVGRVAGIGVSPRSGRHDGPWPPQALREPYRPSQAPPELFSALSRPKSRLSFPVAAVAGASASPPAETEAAPPPPPGTDPDLWPVLHDLATDDELASDGAAAPVSSTRASRRGPADPAPPPPPAPLPPQAELQAVLWSPSPLSPLLKQPVGPLSALVGAEPPPLAQDPDGWGARGPFGGGPAAALGPAARAALCRRLVDRVAFLAAPAGASLARAAAPAARAGAAAAGRVARSARRAARESLERNAARAGRTPGPAAGGRARRPGPSSPGRRPAAASASASASASAGPAPAPAPPTRSPAHRGVWRRALLHTAARAAEHSAAADRARGGAPGPGPGSSSSHAGGAADPWEAARLGALPTPELEAEVFTRLCAAARDLDGGGADARRSLDGPGFAEATRRLCRATAALAAGAAARGAAARLGAPGGGFAAAAAARALLPLASAPAAALAARAAGASSLAAPPAAAAAAAALALDAAGPAVAAVGRSVGPALPAAAGLLALYDLAHLAAGPDTARLARAVFLVAQIRLCRGGEGGGGGAVGGGARETAAASAAATGAGAGAPARVDVWRDGGWAEAEG